jgi:hypothetical protein
MKIVMAYVLISKLPDHTFAVCHKGEQQVAACRKFKGIVLGTEPMGKRIDTESCMPCHKLGHMPSI